MAFEQMQSKVGFGKPSRPGGVAGPGTPFVLDSLAFKPTPVPPRGPSPPQAPFGLPTPGEGNGAMNQNMLTTMVQTMIIMRNGGSCGSELEE